MIRLNPAQIFTSLYSHKFDCWSVYSHKTAKCTDTPDASSNYLMMHRLCVCVCVSRVCLCTVRVCCGSDSAWSLTRILICFCYFPPDSLFTFLPCPLFEQEVQFHSSGEAHTYSFFFFFFAHTFSTHTSASTHAAFNEKRASTSALNLYAITPPLGFALRSV